MKPPASPYPAAAAGGGWRRGAASRAWLVISDSGRANLEEVGKHSITRRTGLPARDLRVLDPMHSYPSTILGRERAIVTNLVHIKAVITATEVLIPNSSSPFVGPFVLELQARVSAPQQTTEYVDGGREATTKVNLSSEKPWVAIRCQQRWRSQFELLNSELLRSALTLLVNALSLRHRHRRNKRIQFWMS